MHKIKPLKIHLSGELEILPSAESSQSDFDFLVIEADPVSQRDEMKRLRQAVSNSTYSVDAWVMGEEEFEETKQVVGGLAYPANKYGVIVYENA